MALRTKNRIKKYFKKTPFLAVWGLPAGRKTFRKEAILEGLFGSI